MRGNLWQIELSGCSAGCPCGLCPVCGQNWAADPQSHCDCTRPRPGDAELERAALAAAAKRRASMHAYYAAQASQRHIDPHKRQHVAI